MEQDGSWKEVFQAQNEHGGAAAAPR